MHTIALVDPSQQVPDYDRYLAGALVGEGFAVTLVTAPFLYDRPSPVPAGVGLELLFGRFLGGSSQASTKAIAPHPFASRPALRRLLRGLSYPMELAGLTDHLLRTRPSVVHWQWSLLPVLEIRAFQRLRRAGIPVVYTAHNVLPHERRRRHVWPLWQLYRSVDAVVVHSEASRRKLLELTGDPAPRVMVIPMPADPIPPQPPLRADARRALALPPDAPIVLFFGHVRPYKGLGQLIDALDLVRATVPAARLLVAGPFAGGAAAAGRLAAELTERGMAEHVLIRAGYVPRADVDAYFAAADVVALPYVDTDDSAVLGAAWARGRATVTTDVGGLAERSLAAGQVVVPAGNVGRLAAALTELLSDPERLGALEAAALAEARRWTWADAAARHGELYRELAGA